MHRIPGVLLPSTLRLVSVTSPGDGDEQEPYLLHIIPVVQVTCPQCGRTLKVRPGKTVIIADLPLGDHPVLLRLTSGQARCRACAHTVECALPAGQLLRGRAVTLDLAQYLRRHMGKAPLRTLAARTGLTHHQVRDVQRMQEEPVESPQKIRHLGLDEIFILKAKHLVAVDHSAERPRLMRLERVSGSLDGRTSQPLPDGFFDALPEADIVTLDMSTEQMAAVRRRWPQATVIIDRRHLIEVINRDLMTLVQRVIGSRFEHFKDERLMQGALRSFGAAAYPYLHLRGLVLRRQTNLTPADHASWMLLRSEGGWGKTLYEAYLWRESLHDLYDAAASSQDVREALGRWIDRMAVWSNRAEIQERPLSRTWWVTRQYRAEVINYAEHRLTNAQTELTNGMIRHYLRLGRRYDPQTLMALVNTAPPTAARMVSSRTTRPMRWYARAELPAAHRHQSPPSAGDWPPLPPTMPELEWPPRPEPWPLGLTPTPAPAVLVVPQEPPAEPVEATAMETAAVIEAPATPQAPGPRRPRRVPKLLPELGLPQQVWWWLHSKVDHQPLGERWYSRILPLAPAGDLTAWSLLCAGQLGSALTLEVQAGQLQHWRAAVLWSYVQNNLDGLNGAERERQPRLRGLDLHALAEVSPALCSAATDAWVSLTEKFGSLSPQGKAAMTLLERWHTLAHDAGVWAGPKSWTVSSRDSAQVKGTTSAFPARPGDGLTGTFAVLSAQRGAAGRPLACSANSSGVR